jgi:dCTP deaminase
MSGAAVQEWLPIVEEPSRRSGIFPAQWYQGAIQRKEIASPVPIAPAQIQPASIDLRLGATAYRVPASFLPGPKGKVADKLEWLATEKIDLTDGAVLRTDSVYIIELLESLNLKKRVSAVANPKSSTGRLDVFARVITDRSSEFDTIAEQYEGPLWAEIAPRSFNVVVRKGSRLVQLRVKRGAPRPSQQLVQALQDEAGLVQGEDEPDIRQNRIAITVDVSGDPLSKLVGFKASRNPEPIDFDKINHYDPAEYWEPVYRPERGGIVLHPDEFHILASKETIAIPDDYAADMIAYDTLVGEFRVHYAGFFDPGFGYARGGHRGARAVLEVRSHEVPFMVEDGQTVGRLAFERLTEKTDKPYGREIGSSYQYQGLALSKQFRR